MSATFWESEIGEITGTSADAFAKTFTIIPDGTSALARVDSFVNSEYQGNKYLSINWILTEGAFKGQKVTQKLKVFGDVNAKDPAKARHRALNMLKLMYQLFGVKLSHGGEPTDADLAAFSGKIGGIVIRETQPNSEGNQYNWVSEIHEAKGFKSETGIKLLVTKTNNQSPDLYDSAFNRNASPLKTVDVEIPW